MRRPSPKPAKSPLGFENAPAARLEQMKPRFMHQSCRLQRVPWQFLRRPVRRKLAQFVINQRK
jgi:hypothetical protein